MEYTRQESVTEMSLSSFKVRKTLMDIGKVKNVVGTFSGEDIVKRMKIYTCKDEDEKKRLLEEKKDVPRLQNRLDCG